MQVKALLLSAVAVAAVSAQSFDQNACSECVFASFDKNAVCGKMTPGNKANLTQVFANGQVNVPLMSALVQNQEVKDCMCDWSATAFTPTGAASSCTTGATRVCNDSQVAEANSKLTPLKPLLKCSTAPPSATKPGGASPTTGAGSNDKEPSAASMVNLPYALSLAAVGVAAFFGF